MGDNGNIYRHIIFDFDGVLAETNEIRAEGFRELFSPFPPDMVEKTVSYYKQNGGFSRYQIIRYFHEVMLGEEIAPEKVEKMAGAYSGIVKKKVIAAEPVKGSVEFLDKYHGRYDFAVVSGSDQEELRAVCRERDLDKYFVDILGSPTLKTENVLKLLSAQGWSSDDCLFVGDSTTDLEAARAAGTAFVGRRSGLVDWPGEYGVMAIEDLSGLHLCLRED